MTVRAVGAIFHAPGRFETLIATYRGRLLNADAQVGRVATLTDNDLWLAAGPWKEQVTMGTFNDDGEEGFSVGRLCCACDAIDAELLKPIYINYIPFKVCSSSYPVNTGIE